MVVAGGLALLTPVGWVGLIVAGMAIGAGGAGVGIGAWQVETSEQRTAAQDEELNHRVGLAMTMFGSPGSAAGAGIGYLAGGEDGMETGAQVGALLEAGYGLAKGVGRGALWLAERQAAARAAERAEWAAQFAARGEDGCARRRGGS